MWSISTAVVIVAVVIVAVVIVAVVIVAVVLSEHNDIQMNTYPLLFLI